MSNKKPLVKIENLRFLLKQADYLIVPEFDNFIIRKKSSLSSGKIYEDQIFSEENDKF